MTKTEQRVGVMDNRGFVTVMQPTWTLSAAKADCRRMDKMWPKFAPSTAFRVTLTYEVPE